MFRASISFVMRFIFYSGWILLFAGGLLLAGCWSSQRCSGPGSKRLARTVAPPNTNDSSAESAAQYASPEELERPTDAHAHYDSAIIH